MRFGTYGRGIWDLRLQQAAPTGVDLADAVTAPSLALEVQGSADRRELLVNSQVSGEGRLEVYDVSGRQVAVLHDGRISRGTTRIPWDGRASGGGSLPSGRYFCILLLGGSVAFTPVDLP